MVSLKPETIADNDPIESLLDDAFGTDRQTKTSYRYRDGVDPVQGLSMLAWDGDRLAGTIRYWPIRVGGSTGGNHVDEGHPALLLGPLAVARHSQGTGVGATLVFRTLEMAAGAGHDLVLLVGDLPYYARFGFVPAKPHGFFMPGENPDRLLLTTLAPAALNVAPGPVRRWDGLDQEKDSTPTSRDAGRLHAGTIGV
jgi:predicted N-acetyltransferase YhbS